eukprot:1437707-Alexandrium_andersonii.AAC.1
MLLTLARSMATPAASDPERALGAPMAPGLLEALRLARPRDLTQTSTYLRRDAGAHFGNAANGAAWHSPPRPIAGVLIARWQTLQGDHLSPSEATPEAT